MRIDVFYKVITENPPGAAPAASKWKLHGQRPAKTAILQPVFLNGLKDFLPISPKSSVFTEGMGEIGRKSSRSGACGGQIEG